MRFLLRVLVLLLAVGLLGLWMRTLSGLSSQNTGPKEEPKPSSIPSDTFLHVQQLRKKKLQHFCLRHPELNSLDKKSSADGLLSSMTASNKLQMVYCRTKGEGHSLWEQLLQEIEKRADITIETPVVGQQNTTSSPIQLRDYNLPRLEIILRSYTKVIFIRDPLERLISAYMEGFSGEIPFSEFVDNVLALGKSDDWYRPVIDLCHPCFIRYDYIVMHDYLRDEIQHLINRMGVHDSASLIRSSDTQSKQTRRWLTENLFRQLETQQRKELVEAYSSDYEAFTFYSSFLWDNHSGDIS
ncbi:carbohydrate sulfotransferase 11-like [Discoglossus pictus]